MLPQNTQPLVTVVVPVFNGACFIDECLRSVVNQTYSNLEILIIDDGSVDNTVEVIKKFIKKNSSHKIKLFCQSNKGVSSARNKGIIKSRGKYIAFLDADDFWFPNKLQEHISAMTRNKIKILGSFMRYGNVNSKTFGICGETCSTRQTEIKQARLMPVALSSIIFESSILSRITGFDEQLRYSQDLDFLARCAQITEICVLEKPLGVYRLHGNSITTKNAIEQEKNYNFLKFKYSNSENHLRNLSYNQFHQNKFFKLNGDRLANIYFRKFVVLGVNGKIFLGLFFFMKAIVASPEYVIKRIYLRFITWFNWKKQRKRDD